MRIDLTRMHLEKFLGKTYLMISAKEKHIVCRELYYLILIDAIRLG